MVEKLSITNLNGMTSDDKSCAITDMNCVAQDDKSCSITDMNCGAKDCKCGCRGGSWLSFSLEE